MPRCIPSSSHIFLKTINTCSLRQTISSYIYFLRADHYYQEPSPLLKKTESMTEMIYTELAPGEIAQQAKCLLPHYVVLFPLFLSSRRTPASQTSPDTQDLHDLTLHDLTKTTLRNDFINSFQQMCKFPAEVLRSIKACTQRIQFRGVQTLTKEQRFVEAYLTNPNSVSLKASTQKNIIKRKEVMRTYKFSWVTLKM